MMEEFKGDRRYRESPDLPGEIHPRDMIDFICFSYEEIHPIPFDIDFSQVKVTDLYIPNPKESIVHEAMKAEDEGHEYLLYYGQVHSVCSVHHNGMRTISLMPHGTMTELGIVQR